jgi:hypothetical protein
MPIAAASATIRMNLMNFIPFDIPYPTYLVPSPISVTMNWRKAKASPATMRYPIVRLTWQS